MTCTTQRSYSQHSRSPCRRPILTFVCRSMESWTQHIDGAAALLELRGEDQFQHQFGLRLFIQLRGQIVRVSLMWLARAELILKAAYQLPTT